MIRRLLCWVLGLLFATGCSHPLIQDRTWMIHENKSFGVWFHAGKRDGIMVRGKPGWAAGVFVLPYQIEAFGTPHSVEQVDIVREHMDDYYHKDFIWSWPER